MSRHDKRHDSDVRMKVGDSIELQCDSWSFDDAAANFDDHIARSVPQVVSQREFIARLARFFLPENARIYELGVATGRLAERVLARSRGRELRYVGLDNSPAMLALARRNLAADSRFSAELDDVATYSFEPATLILSYYTLQFVPAGARADLLRRIFQALTPGGAFVLYEKTLATNARVQDLMTQLYTEFKLEQGFSAEEVINKAHTLQGIADPRSSAWNLSMLREAGFAAVDIVFRDHCFEGYLAIKD